MYRKKNPNKNAEVKTRLGRVGGHVAKLFIACILILMLVSYDQFDASFSTSAPQGHVTMNLLGTFGSHVTDVLVRLFGFSTYIIPLVLLFSNVKFLKQAFFADAIADSKYPWSLWWPSFLLGLLSLSAMGAIHWSPDVYGYPNGSGGALGIQIGNQLLKLFGLLGASVLVVILCAISISILFSIPWSVLIPATGRWLDERWIMLISKEEAPTAITRPVHETLNSQRTTTAYRSRMRELSLWQRLKGRLLAKQGTVPKLMDSTPRGRTADLFFSDDFDNKPTRQLDETNNTAPESKPRQYQQVASAQNLDIDGRSEPDFSDAIEKIEVDPSVDPSLPDQGNVSAALPDEAVVASTKRDVRIVPLEQTHKQDTGDSTVVTAKRATKIIGCPPVSLLDAPAVSMNPGLSKEEIEQMSELLEHKLLDFGVVAEVVEVNPGPVITRFEIQPAPGTKVSKISNLAKDLARSMAVMSVRVVEVIAGKSVIGIEIPNQHREMVCISEVLGSQTYQASMSPLTMGLGNDIAGKPVVVDLAKMPHLLVAGTTGSGKSVGVNAMIISLLLKSTPEQVRLLLVDPKMLELSIYDGIPHLLAPVITDMKEAAGGLRWCVAEMERRYKVMASQGVRNVAGYNNKVDTANQAGAPIPDPVWQPNDLHGETPADRPNLETFPYIVVVVDEFADMMMIVGKKVEELIARIAQKARAAGIHLILATQRPSVDVITGLIKANVPTRIAFQVSSKIDSRTILDQGGAESLLGHGDMLYLPAGKSVPERVHGAFVSDDEVHRIVEDWKKRGSPVFIDAIVDGSYDQEGGSNASGSGGDYEEEQDDLYDEAVAFITETRRASISSVQRRFKIGYNRAARMIESMEAAGVITSQAHNGSREVLAPPPPKD